MKEDDLKDLWKAAGTKQQVPSLDAEKLIALASTQKRKTWQHQAGNVLVLVLTLVVLGVYFFWLTGFKQWLSHVGIGLMMGGLTVRIAIELYSIWLGRRVDVTQKAREAARSAKAYYSFRKRINGPVTYSIVAGYSIGFYLLVPEFSLYFSTFWVILFSASYIPAAVMFTWQIRRAIRYEENLLQEVLRIEQALTGTEP